MSLTRWTTFALVGWTLAVVGGLGGLVVRVVRPAPILTTTFGVGPTNLVAIAVLGITWATVGALLMVRRPENPVGRLMILVGAVHAMSVTTVAVAFAALEAGTAAGRGAASVAGALTAMLTPILVLVFYLPFIFPTGRGHTPRWDTIGRVWLGIAMIFAALLVLQPGDVHLLPGIANPIGFGPDLRPVFGERVAGGVATVTTVVLTPVMILAVASRYRRAGLIERQQLRWFILAGALTVCASAAMFTVAALTQGPVGEAPLTVFALSGTTVPVAIGIAILRYRLYAIDRIISRTIAYGAITAVLFAVFAMVNLAMQTALRSVVTGNTVAVAVSTLAVAALFNPLRTRLQRAVDRRFNRSHHDQERVLNAFAAGLRDEVDVDHLVEHVRVAVEAAVEPRTLSVWRRRAEAAR